VTLTITYLTMRRQPRFDWFCDSLASQASSAELEQLDVVVVDTTLWWEATEARYALLQNAVGGRFPVRHLPPKDSPYQGPHRLTQNDYFCASSVRNTAIGVARGDYIVFVDDVSVLMPGWFDRVRAAAASGYIVLGSYQRHCRMVVDRGQLASSERIWLDSRWSLGSDVQPVPMYGSGLYGPSFGAPLEALLEVNGHDELCDTIGQEDCHLGLRLERAGWPLYYDRRMLTIESEELHSQPYRLTRLDRVLSPRRYLDKLREFGVTHRSTDGLPDASHLMLDIFHGSTITASLLNPYDLRQVRQNGGLFPIPYLQPTTYWVDDSPLNEL
jgi:hypothetical protein